MSGTVLGYILSVSIRRIVKCVIVTFCVVSRGFDVFFVLTHLVFEFIWHDIVSYSIYMICLHSYTQQENLQKIWETYIACLTHEHNQHIPIE